MFIQKNILINEFIYSLPKQNESITEFVDSNF
jgi:hypothetical protein